VGSAHDDRLDPELTTIRDDTKPKKGSRRHRRAG
jgi:hypothetical protein